MFPLHDDIPTQIRPFVTIGLIILCVLVFFWQLSLGEAEQYVIYSLGVIPAVLLSVQELPPELILVPPWATLFSSMFLHGGWMHLIGNMLYLWIFGNNVEDAMGHGRFIVFYMLCGVIAALSNAIPDADSVIPMIGASGAISGILGAYLLLYPPCPSLSGYSNRIFSSYNAPTCIMGSDFLVHITVDQLLAIRRPKWWWRCVGRAYWRISCRYGIDPLVSQKKCASVDPAQIPR